MAVLPAGSAAYPDTIILMPRPAASTENPASGKTERQLALPFWLPAERAPQATGVLAAVFLVYFWRNFSTRPAVSTIFCLPV